MASDEYRQKKLETVDKCICVAHTSYATMIMEICNIQHLGVSAG